MNTRAWLLDLDGVVYRGDEPIPGAVEFIAWLQQTGQPFLFLTNHSARTTESFAEKLRQMGMSVDAGHVLSSSVVTGEFLRRERSGQSVFAVGEIGLQTALRDCGIPRVDTDPRIVVVGFDRALTYERLTTACGFILRGAEFIGTNADATYPLRSGPAPECGAMLAAVEAATGRKPLIMGKPERFMYEEALRRLGVTREQAVMVGDRLDTDICGASRAGIRSVLVLSGVTSRSQGEASPVRPDVICDDLRACRDCV